MCAGSLASGCEFSKHLFVPKQKMVVIFVVPQTVILEAWCVHFGALGTILAPWASLGTSGRTCGEPESDFLTVLGWFWHPILKVVWAPRVRNPVLFTVSFPCHFWHRISKWNLGTWGLKFGFFGMYCKTQFSAEAVHLNDFGFHFCSSLVDLGLILMALRALTTSPEKTQGWGNMVRYWWFGSKWSNQTI